MGGAKVLQDGDRVDDLPATFSWFKNVLMQEKLANKIIVFLSVHQFITATNH